MSLSSKNRKQMAVLAAISTVPLTVSGTALASGSNLPHVEEVKLNLGNPQAILSLKNGSVSGKISDFKLEMINKHITFAGLSGKLVCGDHGPLVRGAPTKPTSPHGKPILRYGIVNDVINSSHYSVDHSEFTLDIYKRKGSAKWKGHKKIATGNGPYTFKVPVSKLKQPGKETSLDVVQYFNNRMQDYINNGGNKIDFLRNDQLFVVPAFLTLQAGCFSQIHRIAYDVKQVSVALSYSGDKSLKYTPTVQTGDTGTVQTPLQVTDVDIAVTPGTSTGQCPRKIPAKAKIKFNQAPKMARNYQYRFLEEGTPVSGWKTLALKDKSWAKLTHMISVEKDNKPQAGNKKLGKKAPGNGQATQLNLPQQIKQKSTVAIEVKADGNSKKMAVAQYIANCAPAKKGIVGLDLNTKPDLTSREGIAIGMKSTAWGGTLVLDKSDFTTVTPRGCRARFAYDVVNIGEAMASGFNSRLRRSGQNAHLKSGMTLGKHTSTKVSGNILLTSGTYPVTASIDDGKTVSETKENNNVFKVMVVVPKECGGGRSRPQ